MAKPKTDIEYQTTEQRKTVRVPLFGSHYNRDYTANKDQRFVNCYPELSKNLATDLKKNFLVKRPGTTEFLDVGGLGPYIGTGQLTIDLSGEGSVISGSGGGGGCGCGGTQYTVPLNPALTSLPALDEKFTICFTLNVSSSATDYDNVLFCSPNPGSVGAYQVTFHKVGSSYELIFFGYDAYSPYSDSRSLNVDTTYDVVIVRDTYADGVYFYVNGNAYTLGFPSTPTHVLSQGGSGAAFRGRPISTVPPGTFVYPFYSSEGTMTDFYICNGSYSPPA